MLSKTISSAALDMLGGLGSSTNNTPTVNNNITINTTPSEEKFIEPGVSSQAHTRTQTPAFTHLYACTHILCAYAYRSHSRLSYLYK